MQILLEFVYWGITEQSKNESDNDGTEERTGGDEGFASQEGDGGSKPQKG